MLIELMTIYPRHPMFNGQSIPFFLQKTFSFAFGLAFTPSRAAAAYSKAPCFHV